jgi:hypothetical protein
MTEASIGKDVTRARVMLTNLVGVVTLRPKKDGLESRAARKCAHPTGGTAYIAPIGAGSPSRSLPNLREGYVVA